jgi:Ca2+/Na+ antiporter
LPTSYCDTSKGLNPYDEHFRLSKTNTSMNHILMRFKIASLELYYFFTIIFLCIVVIYLFYSIDLNARLNKNIQTQTFRL